MEDLEKALQDLFGLTGPSVDPVVTNLRQVQLLEGADLALSRVEQGIEEGVPEDLLTVDLMEAYQDLGRIIGEEVEDDLVEEVFSRFCMGK